MPSWELLFIDGYGSSCDYKPTGGGGLKKGPPSRDRYQHGALMCSQWRAIWAERDRVRSRIESAEGGSSDNKGCYIDFNSAPGYGLKVESLESRSNGIALSNVTEIESTSGEKYTRATLFLPEDKKDVIGKKLDSYLTEDVKGKDIPKNNDLVAGIESMSIRGVDSLWADAKNLMPQPGGSPMWCEVWLTEPETPDSLWSQGSANFDMLKTAAAEINITVKDQLLKFPGRSVCLVFATRGQLETLMARVGCLGELKRAKEPSDYFTDLSNRGQAEWVNDILSRLAVDNSSDVSVCVLDSGVLLGRRLLTVSALSSGDQALMIRIRYHRLAQ